MGSGSYGLGIQLRQPSPAAIISFPNTASAAATFGRGAKSSTKIAVSYGRGAKSSMKIAVSYGRGSNSSMKIAEPYGRGSNSSMKIAVSYGMGSNSSMKIAELGAGKHKPFPVPHQLRQPSATAIISLFQYIISCGNLRQRQS